MLVLLMFMSLVVGVGVGGGVDSINGGVVVVGGDWWSVVVLVEDHCAVGVVVQLLFWMIFHSCIASH